MMSAGAVRAKSIGERRGELGEVGREQTVDHLARERHAEDGVVGDAGGRLSDVEGGPPELLARELAVIGRRPSGGGRIALLRIAFRAGLDGAGRASRRRGTRTAATPPPTPTP